MMRSSWALLLVVASSPTLGDASCDAFHYLSSDALKCEPCPSNSRRYPTSSADVVGTSVAQCLCLPGFFQANHNGDCLQCPDGGICSGGTAAPYPQRNFFGFKDVKLPVSVSPPFLPCTGNHACLGGEGFSCGAGWEGPLCAVPGDGRFLVGTVAADCPSHPDKNDGSFGNLRGQIAIALVVVSAAAVVTLLLKIVLVADKDLDGGDSTAFSAGSLRVDASFWNCLQVLALALRLNHVPWPPVLHSALQVVADTVLLDLRPIARLLVGCGFGPSHVHNNVEGFFLHWGLTLGVLTLAVVSDLVLSKGGCSKPTARHMYTLFRLMSPVWILAGCEVLACQKYPDNVSRLRADPDIACWGSGSFLQPFAASIAILALMGAVLLLVALSRQLQVNTNPGRGDALTIGQARIVGVEALALTGMGVLDVAQVWALCGAVTFLADQPTEVVLVLVLGRTACLVITSLQNPFRDPSHFVPSAYLHLSVVAFALAALTLIFCRGGGGQSIGSGSILPNNNGDGDNDEEDRGFSVEEWLACGVAVVAFAVPLFAVVVGGPLSSVLERLCLEEEVRQAAITRQALSDYETIQLVVVRCHGLKANNNNDNAKNKKRRMRQHVDSHPRLMITAVNARGKPLTRPDGRTKARVVALDPKDMQPAHAHCLTYSLLGGGGGGGSEGEEADSSATARFKVEVLDSTRDGVDRAVCVGTFSLSLATEAETSVAVPLSRSSKHHSSSSFSKRHTAVQGSAFINCSYSVPGELLVARERFASHPLAELLSPRRLCALAMKKARPRLPRWCFCLRAAHEDEEQASRTTADETKAADELAPLEASDCFLHPFAVAQFATSQHRLPQDHLSLRASLAYLNPKLRVAKVVSAAGLPPTIVADESATSGVDDAAVGGVLTPGGAAALTALVTDVDVRFLDLIVAECEGEASRSALVTFLNLLATTAAGAAPGPKAGNQNSAGEEEEGEVGRSGGGGGGGGLPVDGAFAVDWLTKCNNPSLLDAMGDLLDLAKSRSITDALLAKRKRPVVAKNLHLEKEAAEERAQMKEIELQWLELEARGEMQAKAQAKATNEEEQSRRASASKGGGGGKRSKDEENEETEDEKQELKQEDDEDEDEDEEQQQRHHQRLQQNMSEPPGSGETRTVAFVAPETTEPNTDAHHAAPGGVSKMELRRLAHQEKQQRASALVPHAPTRGGASASEAGSKPSSSGGGLVDFGGLVSEGWGELSDIFSPTQPPTDPLPPPNLPPPPR